MISGARDVLALPHPEHIHSTGASPLRNSRTAASLPAPGRMGTAPNRDLTRHTRHSTRKIQ